MKSAAPRHQEADPGPAEACEQPPLRLLLLTDRPGEVPWVVRAIVREMSPVELVQVSTLANAMWRLGRERFDTVMLHFSTADRQAVEICRRHISDRAAIPVLDLRDDEPPAAVASAPVPETTEVRTSRWPPRAGRRRPGKTQEAQGGRRLAMTR